MDQNQFSELKALIANIDSRLRAIELQTNPTVAPIETPSPAPAPAPAPAHAPLPELKPQSHPHTRPPHTSDQNGNLLGIVGMACIIIAMILLIKFSIDSGWLTPARQMFLAGLFGSSLIAIPFFIESKDKAYISLLPAAGVVILHLTIYGATYLHQLLDPGLGIWMVWAVGGLSLWLLTKFEEDVYAFLAIAGTYIGTYLLKNDGDPFQIAYHLFAWDFIFAAFAVYLQNRKLISTAAYFSLGLVVLLMFSQIQLSTEIAMHVVWVQLIQILIFTLATAIYSVRNQAILTEREAWQLFPVYLFFYGLEYHYLHFVNPVWANIFSLGFAALILVVYLMARVRLGKKHLQSSSAVLTLITLMVYHSCYFVMLGDSGKMVAGLVVTVMLGLLHKSLDGKATKHPLQISYLIIGYSLFLIIFNSNPELSRFVIGMGLAYAFMLFIGYQVAEKEPLIYAAHFMVVLSVFKLSPIIGEIWVAPICVAYAFANLVLALRNSDKVLATASFPVIFFAVGRFLFSNFNDLSQGERIISLVVMGGLIYAGGFIYRKIPSAQT